MDAVIWKQTEVSFSHDLNPVAIATVIEHRKRCIPLSISEEAQDQEQDLQEGHVGTRSKVSSWRMSRGRFKMDSQRKQNGQRDQLEKPRIRSVSDEKMMPISEKLFQKEWRGMGRTEKKGVSWTQTLTKFSICWYFHGYHLCRTRTSLWEVKFPLQPMIRIHEKWNIS